MVHSGYVLEQVLELTICWGHATCPALRLDSQGWHQKASSSYLGRCDGGADLDGPDDRVDSAASPERRSMLAKQDVEDSEQISAADDGAVNQVAEARHYLASFP